MEPDVGELRSKRRVRVRASLWLALVGRLPATASYSRSIAMMMMIILIMMTMTINDDDNDAHDDSDGHYDNDDHDDPNGGHKRFYTCFV